MTLAQEHVVVIGSGFGGAVCAARLAEAGVKVTVLERGPWRDTVPVRSLGIAERSPLPRGRALFTRLLRSVGTSRWWPGTLRLNVHGLFEFFLGHGVGVICSSGVGGGSHVYSAVTVRPLVANYWDGHAPGLSDVAMEPHYRAVLARLDAVTPLADHRIPNLAAVRFREHDVLAPMPPPPDPRLGFCLPEDPDHPREIETADGVRRHEVDYARGDDGFLGSPAGGKTTLDWAYLAPAMRQGLVVRDLCEVDAIVRAAGAGGRRYRVECRDLRTGRRESVDASHVVVAAGTLNTLRLLLHSRDVRGGLAGMPQLGRRFGTNGDLFGFWDYNEPGTDLSRGLPTGGGVRLRDDPDPPVIGGGGWPSVDSYPLPQRLRERIKRGSFIAGIGEDAMDGEVSLRNGRLHIAYDAGGSSIFARLRRTFDAIGARTGRRIYYPRTPITVHPTGGACVGADITRGVVDATGEVFDNPGLYVADAAALPRAPGGPPSMTIAAWSSHVAEALLASLSARAVEDERATP